MLWTIYSYTVWCGVVTEKPETSIREDFFFVLPSSGAWVCGCRFRFDKVLFFSGKVQQISTKIAIVKVMSWPNKADSFNRKVFQPKKQKQLSYEIFLNACKMLADFYFTRLEKNN